MMESEFFVESWGFGTKHCGTVEAHW